MGLLVRDDDYDESRRMTGFNRYKQLLSFYAGHWTILNLIVFVSAIPLITGIYISILSTSLLLLIPCSLLGGAICGPFVATLVDSVQRGLRDDYHKRWDNFRKSMKQNWKCSLIPGAVLGLIIGSYAYYLYLCIYTNFLTSSVWTLVFLGIAAFVILTFQNLYWPQLVLFSQPFKMTLTNIILFTCKYFWRMLLIAAFQLCTLALMAIFLPYSLLVVAIIGIWYYVFLSQFFIYDKLNLELKIEERFLDM